MEPEAAARLKLVTRAGGWNAIAKRPHTFFSRRDIELEKVGLSLKIWWSLIRSYHENKVYSDGVPEKNTYIHTPIIPYPSVAKKYSLAICMHGRSPVPSLLKGRGQQHPTVQL